MRLLVDCGNTRIKWGLATADAVVERGQTAFRDDPDSALAMLAPLAGRRLESIDIASVLSDELTTRLAESLAGRGAAVRLVRTRAAGYGLRVAYADPESLGVDRWLAMIAGHAGHPGPVCIVSAGTAVTFDAVDAEGTHLGGLIWPGPRLAASALAAGTDRIGPTDDPGPMMPPGIGLLGHDTVAAVGHGSLLALAAGIDRAARIVAEHGGGRPALVLTGGDAARLAVWLETAAVVEPDLVLEGLRIVAGTPVGADA